MYLNIGFFWLSVIENEGDSHHVTGSYYIIIIAAMAV